MTDATTKPGMFETDLTGFRNLYLAVVDFLVSCGGPYDPIKAFQCRRLLECLDRGLYRLRRDDSGRIVQFAAFWKIHEDDLPTAQRYKRPTDIEGGDILFVVDGGSLLGTRDEMKEFSRIVATVPGVTRIAGVRFRDRKFVQCLRDERRGWRMCRG